MTGVNCLEFTVGLGTCGSLIYSKPRTSQVGKRSLGKGLFGCRMTQVFEKPDSLI